MHLHPSNKLGVYQRLLAPLDRPNIYPRAVVTVVAYPPGGRAAEKASGGGNPGLIGWVTQPADVVWTLEQSICEGKATTPGATVNAE